MDVKEISLPSSHRGEDKSSQPIKTNFVESLVISAMNSKERGLSCSKGLSMEALGE